MSERGWLMADAQCGQNLSYAGGRGLYRNTKHKPQSDSVGSMPPWFLLQFLHEFLLWLFSMKDYDTEM